MNRRQAIAAGAALPFFPTLTLAQAPVLPPPTGPHPVGRLVEDWKDDQRPDTLAPVGGTPRELAVVLWYPARANSLPRAPYYPAVLSAAIASQPNGAQRLAQFARVAPTAADGATAAGGSRFPIVILKPALGASAMDYTALAEELASHGYLVAGSDSPYVTPLVAYQDGRVVRRPAGLGRGPAEPHPLAPGQPNGGMLPSMEVCAQDETFILDRLTRLNADRQSPFRGRLDLSAVGAVGHSFGGSSGMEFARRDARCKAVVNMEGAPLGEVVRQGLKQPLLTMVSEGATNPPANDADRALIAAIDRLRTAAPNQPSRAVILGARHFNFSDQATYVDLEQSRRMMALGSADPRVALAAANHLARAFFDARLKSRRSAFPPPDISGARLD